MSFLKKVLKILGFQSSDRFSRGYFYYRDVAIRIKTIHMGFERCGLKQGDKVALCGRNQAHWPSLFGDRYLWSRCGTYSA